MKKLLQRFGTHRFIFFVALALALGITVHEAFFLLAQILAVAGCIYLMIDVFQQQQRRATQANQHRITSKTDAELDGAIILMHVGERSTADALPTIIADLQARGFHLVTISTLLR
jgi:peptidoglycan/xylan/chitin deacetylase (PgdA/CDA1 family)